jgi:hypothetical protein
MNIFGEGFHPDIINQINQRQKRYGSVERTTEELTYLNSKTGWVKLISSVDIEKRERDTATSVDDRLKLIGVNTSYRGNKLAKEFILFNGTSIQDKKGVTQRENITNTNSSVNDFAYGLGGNEFGLRPMPGILSAEIKTLNRGSIKESTVRIKAFNRVQFQIIDVLYLRLGYPILLEWGHSVYYDNKGKFHNGSDNDWSIAYDFLEGKLKNYYDILSKIQKNRLDSNGNYDALLGKVKNYNWTFDRDGNYDITLSIISVGDVIESLQTNTLGPSIQFNNTSTTTNSYLTGSSQEVIQSSKFKHTLGNILATTQENIDKLPASNSMVSYKSPNSSKIDAVRVDWQNHGNEYYYRFGSFLQVLEDNIIYASDKQPIIKIDYDDANYIPYFPWQVSADPRKCIVRKLVPIGTSTADLFKGCEKYAFTIGEGTNKVTVGILMNIYINFQYILTKLDELKDPDTGKVPIISFLDALCGAINESLGSKNMVQPVVDENTNTIVFIDETPMPNQKTIISYLNTNGYSDKLDNTNGDIASFDVYGYRGGFDKERSTAGFIKDFSLSTTISPDLATIITVGATANGKVVGEDATAFSKWNAALKNRVTETFTDNKLTSPATSGSSEPTVEELYKEAYSGYREYIQELSQYKWDEDGINIYSDTLRNLLVAKTAYDASKSTKNETSLSTGFLPINLSLTMEGLSGMKVYQQFLVDTSYLPNNYPDFFKFLIKTIVHKIENNTWTTSLETMSATTNTFNNSGEENESSSETRAASRINIDENSTANTDALNQKDNIKKAFDFFIKKGFSRAQSAGIVGNLLFESRLNPKIANSKGGAYGIAQWLGDRKKKLFKKPNYDTLEVQLDYIWEELRSTESGAYTAVKKTTTAAQAAIVWDNRYERSERIPPELLQRSRQKRVAFANDVFKKYT